MRAEYLALKKRAATQGPSRGDYERRDTIASLTMGVTSLIAPIVMPKLLKPFTPGKGKLGKALVATAIGAVAVTTVADVMARRAEARRDERRAQQARNVASVGGVTAVVTGGVAVASWWSSNTTPKRMWERRHLRDRGNGPFAVVAAIIGWDFIYYWSHRHQHESRYMWAIHVVHHSSERYNLSTALRQPVADVFGTFVPYGLLALAGIPPGPIARAPDLTPLYQYWIHTDTIRTVGPFERVLNTPSHHRVHHGSNRQYIDRNHGSILIVWDRLFGTFQREGEPVVYGLTKNLDTFDPGRIAAHEHYEMLRDVARSDNWRDRLG